MPQSAPIDNAAASGNTTLVAAVTGKRICVHGYHLSAAGSVVVFFRDTAGATYTGAMSLIAGEPHDAGFADSVLFRLPENVGLQLNASGAVQVSGHLLFAYE